MLLAHMMRVSYVYTFNISRLHVFTYNGTLDVYKIFIRNDLVVIIIEVSVLSMYFSTHEGVGGDFLARFHFSTM